LFAVVPCGAEKKLRFPFVAEITFPFGRTGKFVLILQYGPEGGVWIGANCCVLGLLLFSTAVAEGFLSSDDPIFVPLFTGVGFDVFETVKFIGVRFGRSCDDVVVVAVFVGGGGCSGREVSSVDAILFGLLFFLTKHLEMIFMISDSPKEGLTFHV
jgi:hypothetical protein